MTWWANSVIEFQKRQQQMCKTCKSSEATGKQLPWMLPCVEEELAVALGLLRGSQWDASELCFWHWGFGSVFRADKAVLNDSGMH